MSHFNTNGELLPIRLSSIAFYGVIPIIEPLLLKADASEVLYAVYPRRWWLLFLLSIGSAQMSWVWMTWSPIVTQVQHVYGWSTASIDLLSAWGPLVYVLVALPSAAIAQRIGIRGSIALAVSLSLAGTIIRSFTTRAPYALVLAHAGQITNALAGPLVTATPSMLSAEWFAPHQRATATSIAVMSNYAGMGACPRKPCLYAVVVRSLCLLARLAAVVVGLLQGRVGRWPMFGLVTP